VTLEGRNMAQTYEERRLAADEALLKQKEAEQKAATGPSAIMSSILGLGSAVGGAAATLRKQPETGYLKKMQRGQGAGASLARQTASEAARRVVGASTAQPSSGRGGNLREGLRAADEIVQRGAQQAAITGAQEAQAATTQLRQGIYARREAGAKFGGALGQSLSSIGAVLASAKDQGPVPPTTAMSPLGDTSGEATQERYGQTAQVDPATGLSTAPVSETDKTISAYEGAQGQLQRTAQGPYKEAIDKKSAAMQERGQLEAEGARAEHPLEQSVNEMADATAKKQNAAAHYAASVDVGKAQGPMSIYAALSPPPPATAGPELEKWIYMMAFNYNPRIGYGLSPKEAASMLTNFGFTPDLVALGIDSGEALSQ